MKRSIGFILSVAISFAVVTVWGQGCAGPEPASVAQSSTEGEAPSAVRECETPAGVSGSPRSIEDVVALINALPKPVSVSCFLQALDRPLRISATSSATSAQPASGARSPRVFLFSDKLIISVVPDGLGRKVVEFSVLQSSTTSIKGELDFPVTGPLAQSAPYDTILYRGGTLCSVCHRQETPATGVTFAQAFVSRALRPDPATRVGVTQMQRELAACDSSREKERCDILRSLLGFGEVVEQSFPQDMPTTF